MPKVESFNRKEVLERATQVFHNKGYNGTSMQDLVNATGLNRSSIYNSFGSKLSLFKEVLSYYQSINNKRMNKNVVANHNASDAIKAIFEMFLDEIVRDTDKKGCLLVNCKSEMANQEPLVKSFLEQNQDQMMALLEDIVYSGQMERIFNDDQSAYDYALFLYSSIQGLRMIGILNTNEEELQRLVDTILKVIH